MNKIGFALVVTTLAMFGCGSDDNTGSGGSVGAPPDFAALETKLSTPTGTLSPGQEGAVTDAFGKQQNSTSANPFGGTSGTKSAGLGIQSLVPLGGDANTCPGIQNGGKGSCACPGGGSLDYDLPAGGLSATGKATSGANEPVDVQLAIAGHNCGDGNGAVIDGTLFFKAHNPPPELLIALHLNVTGGGHPGKYDVDFAYMNGVLTFAVDVPDGRVIVQAKGQWDSGTKSGSLVIKDKNETWTCTATNGKGSCTSDKGQTRNFG